MTHLTPRFEEALALAWRLHAGQRRKLGGAPYLAHPLAVAALILEDGGDEDEAIAGLLHDAPEDQGGAETLAEIRRRFGDQVADDIAACSDTLEDPKPPWRARKEAHLAHLRGAPPRVLRITAADKLHNAQSVLRALRAEGPAIFEAFKGKQAGTLWYYRAMIEVIEGGYQGGLLEQLHETLQRVEALCHP